MPIRVFVTEGTTADCTPAILLIEDIKTEYLLADRAYDTNKIMEYTSSNMIKPVIPSKKNRKQKRKYDKEIYRLRYRVENAFSYLKQWGGIATRYAKNTASFLAPL